MSDLASSVFFEDDSLSLPVLNFDEILEEFPVHMHYLNKNYILESTSLWVFTLKQKKKTLGLFFTQLKG